MKKLLWLSLFARVATAQPGIRAVVVNVPYESQAALDTAQNARLRSIDTQLKAMGTMTQALSTDSYTTLAGNLVEVLPVGTRKLVFNTAYNLPEGWLGTSAGNRLTTIRIANYPVVVATGQTVVNIPHGLPYTPIVQVAVVSPAGTGNPSYVVNATNIVLTLPTAPLVSTPYVFNWMGR